MPRGSHGVFQADLMVDFVLEEILGTLDSRQWFWEDAHGPWMPVDAPVHPGAPVLVPLFTNPIFMGY